MVVCGVIHSVTMSDSCPIGCTHRPTGDGFPPPPTSTITTLARISLLRQWYMTVSMPLD